MSDERETIYIVASGEYSDYSIDSVWTTRAAAEQHAGGWGEVTEWYVNTPATKPPLVWRAYINRANEVEVMPRPQGSQEVLRTHIDVYDNGKFYAEGYGSSPERARKSLAGALAKFYSEQANL